MLNPLTIMHPSDSRLYEHYSLAGPCYKQLKIPSSIEMSIKHTDAQYSNNDQSQLVESMGDKTLK